LFHVSSVLNRESIKRHGLDWTRMGATCGIAGSRTPEVEGVFLCLTEFDVDFFVQMNAPGTELDVWAVRDVIADELVESVHGFYYTPARIPPDRLTRHDAPASPYPTRFHDGPSSAYESTLAIEFDDGTLLRDGEVREFIRGIRRHGGG
jgi:hypothetical protein